MITASAPGKVVLWGEYAVLEGAPAAVLAIDRFAGCSVETSRSWRIASTGFEAAGVAFERLPETLPKDAAAILPWQVLQGFPQAAAAPVTVTLRSDDFFDSGVKLGLGSSAALCVAVQAAIAAQRGDPPDHAQALAAHRRLQDGHGSGIDIAASFFGGCLRFADGKAQPCRDPLIHRCFVWVGEPARTHRKLQLFRDYLERGNLAALHALANCSAELFDDPSAEALDAYTAALKTLDNAAGLGVYSAPHLAAERLAKGSGLVYKPCGAGGGDIGVAIADSPEPVPRFAAAAEALGFKILNLETAAHGVQVEHPSAATAGAVER